MAPSSRFNPALIQGDRISYRHLSATDDFAVHTHMPVAERLLKNGWDIHVSLGCGGVNSSCSAADNARDDVKSGITYSDM
jgi:hypothetical protein